MEIISVKITSVFETGAVKAKANAVRHQGMRGEKRPVRGDALIQVCKRKIHRYLFSNG